MAETKVNKSQAIRDVLEKHKGNVTYGEVKAEMEKIGVPPSMFGVIKSKWKKDGTTPASQKKAAKKGKSATPATLSVAVSDAVAFVQEAGGLNSALSVIAAEQAGIDKKRALVEKFQEVAALAGK